MQGQVAGEQGPRTAQELNTGRSDVSSRTEEMTIEKQNRGIKTAADVAVVLRN